MASLFLCAISSAYMVVGQRKFCALRQTLSGSARFGSIAIFDTVADEFLQYFLLSRDH